jgi:pimeloyl-ACP methyl ester carboxylesterase
VQALPVLLLHANPGSGEGLEPLLRSIAHDRMAVAIDLPGHGRSDPLPPAVANGATLAGAYAPVLLEAMDALGLDRVDVYGTHTGAGLAAELAVAAPGRVRSLVLDGVPLFDDDPALVAAVLAGYFPDLTPDRHGSHLVRAWNMTRDMALWWPWFQQDPDSIRDGEPYPEATLERVTADLLHSLPAYDISYRAAWTWPGTQRLPLVTQPVLVGSSPSDPLLAMTPRAVALLNDARETTFPPSGPQRPEALARCIATFAAGLG